ncbi:hypothetical protein LOAG_15119 [Loa loa]|uniref:Uncharacterized protein n=1 Tax=Loa loa TaxID=7209 RepID=A0A1S0TGJ8_LOALO|nr:hypothetical protein LOAG_15119 [Loa loa]EFO13410.1 hypothetical protein LOAG_15119 [Loa loa]
MPCQKIVQQRLRLLGSFSNSAKTSTSTTSTSTTTITTTTTTATTTTTTTSTVSTFHSNSCSDHRNSNYQDLVYSNGYNSKNQSCYHQRSVSALPLQEHLQQQQHGNGSDIGYHGNGIHYTSNNTVQMPTNYGCHRENSTLTTGILL